MNDECVLLRHMFALTHVGQIALLCRLGDAMATGENYFKAEVETVFDGTDPESPVFEFD